MEGPEATLARVELDEIVYDVRHGVAGIVLNRPSA
jgi:hypothetical protein